MTVSKPYLNLGRLNDISDAFDQAGKDQGPAIPDSVMGRGGTT